MPTKALVEGVKAAKEFMVHRRCEMQICEWCKYWTCGICYNKEHRQTFLTKVSCSSMCDAWEPICFEVGNFQ